MAKDKKTPKKPNRSPSWVMTVRIDTELEALIAAYQDRQQYRPTLAQVVERGLRLVLEEEAKTKPAE